MKLLGLDISTSMVGWNIRDEEKILETGYINLKKIDDMFCKVDKVDEELEKIFQKYQIDYVGVEAALERVSGGKTNANTMNKLVAMNFAVSYLIHGRGVSIIRISVNTARKICGIKIPRKISQTEKKNIVIEHHKRLNPDLVWDLTRNETYKDYCGDIADSLTISKATLELINEQISNTSPSS